MISDYFKNPLPVLPLRDLVMFPKMIVPLFVGRNRSIKALESAGTNSYLFLVAQKDAVKDTPKTTDIYRVGVISKVLQVLKLQDSTIKILVEGITRAKVMKFINEEKFLRVELAPLLETPSKNLQDAEVLHRSLIELFEEYAKINRKINPEILINIIQIKDITAFCNAVCAHLMLSVQKKQELLEIVETNKKLERLIVFLNTEIELLKAESKIKTRVKSQIEKNQKDYYLNEQLKAIHKELGEEDFKEEVVELSEKLKKLKLTKEAKEKSSSELRRLKMMNPMSSEATVIRNYLEWIIDLPWVKYNKINKNLSKAQNVLNKDHYGLEKVKDRIIEYLAVTLKTNHLAGPIICLVGPPGVGKTSLARSIASATGRNFVKISLGGLRDESEIKGHRRTYIGSQPGKILQAMKKAKSSNPLVLLDEIDKMSFDYKGDPASALLEVLDRSQNKNFNDHYLEVDYDISKVMFIATANSMNLPRPLLDRIEIINLSGYTENEKVEIAKQHLIPKQNTEHGVTKKEVNIKEDLLLDIIRFYTKEAGVRNLERELAKILRKSVKKMMLEDKKRISITHKNLKDFLGVKKFNYGEIEKQNKVGITNGLAYTEVGGDLLAIEAVIFNGKGNIKITGKLGDVMKESIQAALSYIKSRGHEFGISDETFKEHDIHVHVPEGAIPKDGPSAGIAMCTSIVSALTGIPIKNTVAMTGEITLRGCVLAIGGLKEKLLAALRGGVKTVIIPKENKKDLEDIPVEVKNNLEILPVDIVDEVLRIALASKIIPLELEGKQVIQKKDKITEATH